MRRDFETTGRLRLALEGGSWIALRHSWADGKKQRLEVCLGQALQTVRMFEHVFKKEAEEAARQAQIEEERRKRAEEERARQAEYARKVGVLRKHINAWHESKLVQDLIDVFTKSSERADMTPEERQDLGSFIEWAKGYATSVDPSCHLVKAIREFKGDTGTVQAR